MLFVRRAGLASPIRPSLQPASILAYTEQTFGLAPLGPNDADAYDFSNAFDYTQAPLGRAAMIHRPLPWTARHIHLTTALLDDPS